MLTMIEEKLIDSGFDAMSLQEKNQLVSVIANKDGKAYFEINEESILEYHQKLKIDELSLTCEETIIKGFVGSNGHTYRTNRDDQVNMIGQKDEITADPSITVVYWKTEDAGYIQHTKEEWLKIYVEAFAYKKKQLFKYNTLKQTILSARSHDVIVETKWEEPEPVQPPVVEEPPVAA